MNAPRTVSIEITSRGFLAGPLAFATADAAEAQPAGREPVDLRIETLKAWLEPCDDVDRVIFTGPGEPLLHPRVAYLVRTARQYGASCVIETGGRVLEGRLVRDLVEAGLDELWVRLDAPCREQARLLRHDDAYDVVIANLAAFADERSMLLARNPEVRVLYLAGAQGSLSPRQTDRLRVTPGVATRAPGPYVTVTGQVFGWGPAPEARDLADLPLLGLATERPLTAWALPAPPVDAPPAPSPVDEPAAAPVEAPADLPADLPADAAPAPETAPEPPPTTEEPTA